MIYDIVKKARFINRPNRFIAQVELAGAKERVHVKNTGRCAELLLPGCTVYLEDSHSRLDETKAKPVRKTRYDLIGVERYLEETGETILINMDSQAPNRVAKEAIEAGRICLPGTENLTLEKLQSERTYGNSRFDLYLEYSGGVKAFVEVKGVTLLEGTAAMFPDAPTERGVKHVNELCKAAEDGYLTAVLFLIQMKGADCFMPNDRTQPEFHQALLRARERGVSILAYDCNVTEDRLEADAPVEVIL